MIFVNHDNLFVYNQYRLTIQYGTNDTISQYLEIIACLCSNSGTCNYDDTTPVSTHYRLASCTCPDAYGGLLT